MKSLFRETANAMLFVGAVGANIVNFGCATMDETVSRKPNGSYERTTHCEGFNCAEAGGHGRGDTAPTQYLVPQVMEVLTPVPPSARHPNGATRFTFGGDGAGLPTQPVQNVTITPYGVYAAPAPQ